MIYNNWYQSVGCDLLYEHSEVGAAGFGEGVEWKTSRRNECTNEKDLEMRAQLTIRLCLADKVVYHIMDEESLRNLVEIRELVRVKVINEQATS